MNRFFELFGGPLAFLLSVLAAVICSRRWRTRRSANTRGIVVGIFYWGPLFLIACMLLHNIQNAWRALVSFGATGAFNFYFYSLQLFGFVVAYQSCLLLQRCREHAAGGRRINTRLLRTMCLIVVTTLPTFAFTPIGIIPCCVLLITFLLSLAVHRSQRAVKVPAGHRKSVGAASGLPA